MQINTVISGVDPSKDYHLTTKQYVDDHTSDPIYNETLSGTVNGSNTLFSIDNIPVTDTLTVFLNGLMQEPGISKDYTSSGTQITFDIAPETGDILLANYLTSAGLGGPVISELSEDDSPQLGGDLDLNGYCIEFVPDPTPDHSFSGFYTTLTVDNNTLGMMAALYIASDGNLEEANASSTNTMPVFGLAMEVGTGSKKIFQQGYARDDSWNWTPGKLIYASTTSGVLTQTVVSGSGDQHQIVGQATHSDRIFFNPNMVMVEIV